MSLLSIICLTGLSAALFAKSCWLCRLIPSCRQPEMSVCQGLYAVICFPSLCIKWRKRDLVHAHSVHFVPLTPQDFHFVHELPPFKERFFVVLVRYLFFQSHFFSRPSPSLYFFHPLPPSTSSALLLRLHLSLLPHIHLSSCLKPSYFCCRKADCPWGSCLCHTAVSILACLCTHLLSGCPRSGCLCLCRPARICGCIGLSSSYSKIRRSRSCYYLESSFLCTRACSAPALFCACGCPPCRFQRLRICHNMDSTAAFESCRFPSLSLSSCQHGFSGSPSSCQTPSCSSACRSLFRNRSLPVFETPCSS